MTDDNLIKQTLDSAKTIAMVGASTVKEGEAVAKTRLKPSIIVMKYLLVYFQTRDSNIVLRQHMLPTCPRISKFSNSA